jgi:SAM-dependent methyltransferase
MAPDGMEKKEGRDVRTRSEASSKYLADAEIHEAWESEYLNPGLDAIYNAIFSRIYSVLKGRPAPQLMDAGCGYCYHSVRIARLGAQVTGVDFSPAALAAAERTIAAAGQKERIELREGSILELPFADGTFDNVLCWGVLMHIPDLEKALTELCRVVAPGGRLVIGENSVQSFHCRIFEPMLRFAKRAIGRKLPERLHTGFGVEEWTNSDIGGLMVRRTDLAALIGFCEAQGLRLVDRFGGQFTEAYAHVKLPAIARMIFAFNERRFARQTSPDGFLGQVMVFERPPA